MEDLLAIDLQLGLALSGERKKQTLAFFEDELARPSDLKASCGEEGGGGFACFEPQSGESIDSEISAGR